MLIIATLGLMANLFSAQLLHKNSSESLNMKAAFLHLIFDALALNASLFKGHATEIFVSVSVLVKPDSLD